MFLSKFSSLAVLSGLTAAALAAQTSTSNTVTRTSSFPPVSIASSETVAVTVVNLASATSSGTAASCAGSISFVNASGAAIGTASSFTLGSGAASTATLPFSSAGVSGQRAAVRAVITLTQTLGQGAAPCSLQSSLEIYDTNTGVTHAILTGTQIANVPVAVPGVPRF